jgi:hypothetical protein
MLLKNVRLMCSTLICFLLICIFHDINKTKKEFFENLFVELSPELPEAGKGPG